MLKIPEYNKKTGEKIDLNIFIEQYGFKPEYDKETGELIELYRIRGDKKGTTINFDDNFNGKHKYRNFWTIFTWNKRISNHGYMKLTDDDYEILYDLILAGLIEKVEE